ncbi:proton glutamate symport protein [Clostridium tepidiprofundi DSM 19306]|uniref:Proton glutamate symport protein n=1 Tax=Clostridium tepidiprofundi DSM 19306 TaxID=1121338 RepID=A0A151B723_9CLOT|nr:dicarboxylate/amino acid:cation symporter [Clostridium tepidiprofundi]KYH35447.1 proton glutamate symport protein [Clostridium tepidiprofundi DSM 19306]
MKKGKILFENLGTWIIVAMFLGIIVGGVMGKNASIFAPLGDIFMTLLKMVVIPLVTFSIITGAASIGNSKSAGKIGIATFVYYLSTTAVAVVVALILGQLFKPGTGLPMEQIKSIFSNEYANKGTVPGFWETIKGIIPANPIASLVQGNILQILFFSLFFGFGIASLKEEQKELLTKVFNAITDALIFVIMKIMYIAPIGVFALMADAVGTFGYNILGLLVKLLVIYVIGLLLQAFGVYSLALKLFSKTPVKKFFSKIYKVQLFALSTSSSMATLPINMETCEEELNVSKETTSFVLPLGATINMDGNAIYYALVACFFAQMFGIKLGMAQYLAIIFTATVGSIGQAGVPGPSLLVVAVLLSANIPIVGLPLLFGVDRLFDMMRTAVNVTGDASCAVIVDRLKE